MKIKRENLTGMLINWSNLEKINLPLNYTFVLNNFIIAHEHF